MYMLSMLRFHLQYISTLFKCDILCVSCCYLLSILLMHHLVLLCIFFSPDPKSGWQKNLRYYLFCVNLSSINLSLIVRFHFRRCCFAVHNKSIHCYY